MHDQIVKLVDEKRNSREYRIIDILEVEGQDYAQMLPVDDDGTAKLLFMRFAGDRLEVITDPSEFERVALAAQA